MDVPAGNTISRISRTKKLSFPDKGCNIGIDLTSLLETVLIGRSLMGNVEALVDNKKRKAFQLYNADSEDETATPSLSHSIVSK
jgi:hypothetical protein